MALRIITADERLSAADNKTTMAIFGAERRRQDHAAEDAAAGPRRSASISRRA